MTTAPTIEHAYGSSAPYTVGVEEEFQLMRKETFELVPRAGELLAEATDDDLLRIKPELMQSVIESATGVHGSVPEAEEELRALRARLIDLAAGQDALLGSAGTHPFSRYEFQQVTDAKRYTDIISRLKWVAQRELIFGLHVHVGIETPEKAIAIFNSIRNYLPQVLALSANSPFWQGRHTGLMSSRIKIFDSFPRSGMPQQFDDWAEWQAVMHRCVDAGLFDDPTYIWWDVRMHPGFGTIEVRIADAQTSIEDTVALAALVQGLCAWLGDCYERNAMPTVHHRMLIDENKWRALRYGIGAELIDFDTDEVVPLPELLGRTLEKIEPFMSELGSAGYLSHLVKMANENGARRQLDLYDSSESLVSVADWIVRETCRI